MISPKAPLLALAAVGVLTGCAAGVSTASSSSTSVSPSSPVVSSSPAAQASPSASPSPSVWTMDQAQAAYLAQVAPYNADLAKFNALGEQPTYASLVAICTKLAADDDTAARAITVSPWPETAKTQAAAFVIALTKERLGWQGCAMAKTQQAAAAATNGIADAAADAEAMRIALGLPGN